MASATLQVGSKLPDGMTAATYLRSGYEPGEAADGKAGKGSAQGSTGSISSGSVTITGLADNTEYYVGGDIGGGVYKFIAFDTLTASKSWVPPDQLPGTG